MPLIFRSFPQTTQNGFRRSAPKTIALATENSKISISIIFVSNVVVVVAASLLFRRPSISPHDDAATTTTPSLLLTNGSDEEIPFYGI